MSNPGYLILSDFDGTIVDTFSPSPNGLDVKSAYKKALGDIFGTDLSETYFASYPLDNRAPSEIAVDFLDKFGWQNGLLERAKDFHSKTATHAYQIPEAESGIPWNESNPAITISAMIVGQKLHYLMDEIGKHNGNGTWPPTLEHSTATFLNSLEELKNLGFPIETGIVSSGHEVPIRKILELHNIKFSGILVTDDTIRQRKYPEEEDRRVKPGQLPLALAHAKWIQKHEDSPGYLQAARETKSRMLLIGDSMSKDGKLAADAGIPFCLYEPGVYAKLHHDLVNHMHVLDGRPIRDLFPTSGILEGETNPRRLEGFYATKLGGNHERQ